MIQYRFFVLLLCSGIVTEATLCMERLLPILNSMPLVVAPNDFSLRIMRLQFFTATVKNIHAIDPCMRTVKVEAPGQRKGVCYNVAMKRSLKLTKQQLGELEIIGCEDWFCYGVLEHYFKRTAVPQAENLVVYIEGSCSAIRHCGVVNDDGTVRSKWGTRREIYDHSLWHVPDEYGNMVAYFYLRKCFKGPQGNMDLLDDLKKRIAQLPDIKKNLLLSKQTFLSYARGTINTQLNILNTSIDAIKARALLKMCMGIEIDVRDEKNNTALMLAAERGDVKFVKLCIIHNADKDLTNNDNKTAYMLACEHNHQAVVEYLKR